MSYCNSYSIIFVYLYGNTLNGLVEKNVVEDVGFMKSSIVFDFTEQPLVTNR